MNEFVAIGLLINSAIYLVCVFVAGFLSANPFAWRLALTSMGLAYLCYFAQTQALAVTRPADIFRWARPWAMASIVLVWISIAFGAAAGLSLLF